MAAESGVTGTLITPAIGGSGWAFIQEFTAEYSSNAAVTVTPKAADSGNGSISASAVTMPSTGGSIAKTKFLVTANKFKLMYFVFASTDPTFKVYTEGFVCRMKSWGGKTQYQQMCPFSQINPYVPEQGGSGGMNS